MPNWTMNNVEITGEKKDIDKLYDDISVDEDVYFLANTLPTPFELTQISTGSITIDDIQYSEWYEDEDGTKRPLLDMTNDELEAKYGCNNSIDWQYLNWGTKWGDRETEVVLKDDTRMKLSFESAWSEPFMLLEHISSTYNVRIVNKHVDEYDYNKLQVTKYPMSDFKRIQAIYLSQYKEMKNSFNTSTPIEG